MAAGHAMRAFPCPFPAKYSPAAETFWPTACFLKRILWNSLACGPTSACSTSEAGLAAWRFRSPTTSRALMPTRALTWSARRLTFARAASRHATRASASPGSRCTTTCTRQTEPARRSSPFRTLMRTLILPGPPRCSRTWTAMKWPATSPKPAA